VFNILLQVLDDGRLTDNKGRTVNFKNTIIIMTSNLGSQYIQSRFDEMKGKDGIQQETMLEETRQNVMQMLKKTIRPEFLNRIDETIMFRPLNQAEIADVVRLQVNIVARHLAESGLTLRVTDAAVELLARAGYDPEFGARPVKRAIQRDLLNDLSRTILSGTLNRERPVTADAQDDRIVFSND
jgi:ATP-dependent Clp protease ATP-binding subunit ClpB